MIHARTILRVMLLSIGATMIAIGLAQGEATAILRKAVIVCMECIGIG